MGNKTYWNGLEDLEKDPQVVAAQRHEFPEELPLEEDLSEDSLEVRSNRRDFLKVLGFGVTAATLSACVEKPLKRAIPYVIKPEDVTPGVPSWYASTCQGCSTGCGALIKTREGRPIKLEGLRENRISQGGLCQVGHATVLSLYDSNRLRAPKYNGADVEWADLDAEVGKKLEGARKVRVLTKTNHSPTSLKAINDFLGRFQDGRHVMYEPISVSAIRKAHKASHGAEVIPSYHFDQAEVIVSFGADFLHTWISPVQFTKDYTKGRKVSETNPKMSRHIQYEAQLSLTGSNADFRAPLRPSQMGVAILNLAKLVAKETGNSLNLGNVPTFEGGAGNSLTKVAKELAAAKGKSLVVCGSNDVASQVMVNQINTMLGNYGKTVDPDTPSYQNLGDDAEMKRLVEELNSGSVDAILLHGVNPAYDYFDSEGFVAALKKAKTRIAFVTKENETSEHCDVVAATNHYMESWSDAQPVKGSFSLGQPVIRPLFETRQFEESLLKWAGNNKPYYDYLAEHWEKVMFPMQRKYALFTDMWNDTVHNGVFYPDMMQAAPAAIAGDGAANVAIAPVAVGGDAPADHGGDHAAGDHGDVAGGGDIVDDAAAGEEGAVDDVAVNDPAPSLNLTEYADVLRKRYNNNAGGESIELVIYEKASLRDGTEANNPWLQEAPDAITKVTWDNYVCVPYVDAQAKGIKDGDLMKLSLDGASLAKAIPALVMPGQARGTLAVAVGYGRTKSGRVGDGVGVNAFPFVGGKSDTFRYDRSGVTMSKEGSGYGLAKTQTFVGYELGGADSDKRELVEGRVEDTILKETTLEAYKVSRISGNKRPSPEHMISLWENHDKKGHHWAMGIDLNACTGCGSCIVSCNAENNVAVVGREEVRLRRDMHWMRLDRYFKGDPADQDGNLEVTHMPMLCQHCDNAPCETVCPVLATVHSDEGLNQQVYNRCIGTRYCANNCPYKVRRFNWFAYYNNDRFDYTMNNSLEKLVLNPDVTVRARGVMEKCSFCVQRIQEKKLKSKVENRSLMDGEIQTACQQSCPADAIVFGDLNDKNSEIRKLYDNKRAYHAIEEIKTLPSVAYLTKVRNKPAHKEEKKADS